ncbi:SIS domain-containing protein [Pseudenterobacter timonensis]|uniref:SIS domain-containing protein n=1 Tax=Pseudenterobacter timonensis TaxID=1755099 RepID=A0ABV4A6V8_9ENTR
MSYIRKIKADLDNYTGTERKIALYILQHIDSFKDCSSHSLASTLNIAQSSISKFAQKLGTRGFTDLKMLLIEENVRAKNAVKGKNLHTTIQSDDPCNVIAEKLISEKYNALRQTTEHINFGSFEKIINLIHSSQRIQITGIGGSALTAKDLAFKLLKIGYHVICEIDSHVQITVAQSLTKQDLQIVISYSGNKKEVLLAAKTAKANGAKIIAITSLAQNPLRDLADYILDTVSNEDEWRSSSISSRTAQNCITDLLFVSLLQLNDARSLSMIQRSRQLINKLE